MAAGDTLRRITPSDSLILDASGNLVGIKSPNAGGSDLRYDPLSVLQAGEFSNFSSTNLSRWRKALANVRAGTGRAKIGFVGDSTTSGTGAGTGGSGIVGAYLKAVPARFASVLNGMGVSAEMNSIVGDGNQNYVTNPTFDPRVTLGTGWGRDTANPSLGGIPFYFTGGSAGTLAFTPAASFDSVDLYYLKFNNAGSATVNVDGGATLVTINSNTGVLVQKTTITGITAGTHTLNIASLATGDLYIVGIDCYLSTAPKVSVFNAGYASASSFDYSRTQVPWTPQNALPTFGFDLAVFNLTINDAGGATDLPTYITRLQAAITAWTGTSDIVLVAGIPSQISTTSVARTVAFRDALKALAVANNLPFIDLVTRFVSHATSSALGYYFSDGIHGTAVGYADVAHAHAKALAYI